MATNSPVVELEEGWQFMAAGLAKIRRAADGCGLTSEEFMGLYTVSYNMCVQKPPNDHSEQLYHRLKEDVENHLRSTVLPPLRDMSGELLLTQLVEALRKHNQIATYQKRIFRYLDCYYVPRKGLPPLQQVFSTAFQDVVFGELKGAVTSVVIGMIDDEREGKIIDRDLVKSVLDIYTQTYQGDLRVYRDGFEKAFLEATRAYYSGKAQTWNMECSDHGDYVYVFKIDECLQKEKERAAHYLHSSTEPKLTEAVRSVLKKRHAEMQTDPKPQGGVWRRITSTFSLASRK